MQRWEVVASSVSEFLFIVLLTANKLVLLRHYCAPCGLGGIVE